MIQSSSTQEKGIALELGLQIRDGFSNPLLAFDEPISSHNPIAHIIFDFEMKCADDSCVLYFIEVCLISIPNLINFIKFSKSKFIYIVKYLHAIIYRN